MTALRAPTETASGNVTPILALRRRDASVALSVSERWLFQATKDGLIPCIRLRGLTLYPVDLLRGWLAEQATQQPEAPT